MYRLVRLSSKWYAVSINELNEEETDEIKTFVDEGNCVVLVEDLEDFADTFGCDVGDIQIVIREE